jgi:hypothetical protein
MSVTKQELPHEIVSLFLKTNLTELNSLLKLLTTSYLSSNNDHSNEDKANFVSLIFDLKDILTSINSSINKTDKDNVLICETKPCTHN